MKAVAVVPSKKELRLVDHPIPQLSDGNQIKVQTLDVGICGTDREICTFVYGSPPEGDDYLVLGHESLGRVVEVGDRIATRAETTSRTTASTASLPSAALRRCTGS